MAAFERVSVMRPRRHDRDSIVDFRFARLPSMIPMFQHMFPNSPHNTNAPDDDPYDPRAHRNPKGPITVWMAYLNLIKASCGPAVLAFPLAVSQTGIVFGSALGIFAGILTIHMHLVLLNCLNEISKTLRIPLVSYRYGFRIALLHGPTFLHDIGRHGSAIIATFMLMSQIGICCVFIDLTSDSLRDVMDWQSTRPAIFCLLLPHILLIYFMKSLKIVSYVSMLGNGLNLIGFSLILYHIFLMPHGEMEAISIEAVPLSVAFGIFLYNSSAVGVILALDKALVDPTILVKKCGLITIGMGVPTVIGIVFGMLGYWSFGVLEENCLRSLPYDDITTMVIFSLYLVSVAFTYPIQCYPAIQIIREIIQYRDPYGEPSEKFLKRVEKIARPAFVLLTFFISYLVPLQACLVPFVGNICTTMLSLAFPALMEICLMYPGPYGRYHIYLIKDLLVILSGVGAWVLGAIFITYLIYMRIHEVKVLNSEYL